MGFPERWGQSSERTVQALAPSAAPAPWLSDWFSRLMLSSAAPSSAEAFIRMAFEIDVREVARTVRVPTLIVHAIADTVCHVENARWYAAHIAGSRYVELPCGDHLAFFEPEPILAEIRGFLTGTREAAVPYTSLVAMLFVDLVDSTSRAASIGDRRWADLLAQYQVTVRREIEQFRGHEIDTAGDGFFITFDGPARAIRAARAIVAEADGLGLEARTGVHVGELGVAGGKPVGLAVHIGARIAALAGPGETLVSSTARDLVSGSGLAFSDRGEHELKGVPEPWRVYALVS